MPEGYLKLAKRPIFAVKAVHADEQVISLGNEATVITPREHIDDMKEMLSELLATYEGNAPLQLHLTWQLHSHHRKSDFHLLH